MSDATLSKAATARKGFALPRVSGSTVVMVLYLLFLFLPIYWLINMSFKTNTEIVSSFSLWPQDPTLENYVTIFTDPAWYMGYVNSLIYVLINTVISLAVALPAAYAFSRYHFMGDKHLFFWLLTNFVAELHGFGSLVQVFLMIILSIISIAFVLSVVLSIIGIAVPGA